MLSRMEQCITKKNKTKKMLFKRIVKLGLDLRRLIETMPTPHSSLQPRILKFEADVSLECQTGDIIPRHTLIVTDGATPKTRGPASQDLGGIFSIPQYGEDIGMNPVMTKELTQLRDMVSNVLDIIQTIPKVSPISQKASRFAPPIRHTEVPNPENEDV